MGGRFRARQNSGHLFVGSPRTPSSLVPRSATRPLFHRIIPFAGQPRENGDTRIDNLERDSVSFGSPPLLNPLYNWRTLAHHARDAFAQHGMNRVQMSALAPRIFTP